MDVIGNYLTIIRNGILAAKSFVVAPYSKMKEDISVILKNEGFIKDFSVLEDNGKKQIKIVLKYVNGQSVIHEINRISTPGRRVYGGSSNLPVIIGKLGISILTTNKGIITNKQARELAVGGEVICSVW